MGPEEVKEAGAFRDARAQRAIVPCQPARERAVAHACEGMQQPQGHHFARPQGRVRMFGEAVQVVIDLIAYGSNKIHGGQEHLRAREGGTFPTSVEEVSDHCNITKENC